MKRVLIAFLMALPTAAIAAQQTTPTALMCFYKPLNLRFNIVTKDEQDMIQWESRSFQAVIFEYKKPYMTIKQYGTSATFKAVIDSTTLIGYGGITLFEGKSTEGEIVCAWD